MAWTDQQTVSSTYTTVLRGIGIGNDVPSLVVVIALTCNVSKQWHIPYSLPQQPDEDGMSANIF